MNVTQVIDRYEKHLMEASTRDRAAEADDGALHVSDVVNGCPRAVWHRIHKGVKKDFTPQTTRKMRMGHLWETHVREAFAFAGYKDIKSEVIALDGVTGHPDILIRAKKNDRKHLIEVKTTYFFRSGWELQIPTPESVMVRNPNYILQAYAYAKAEGADKFTVHIIDRNTGTVVDLEYQTEDPAIVSLWEARRAVLGAALDPEREPEANPPQWTRNAKGGSYLCIGCPVVSCLNATKAKNEETHHYINGERQ
jgi:hypothetical protein